jgi:RNA polymerase sigma-32 factor
MSLQMPNDQDPTLSRYLAAVQKYPRLSREEETELWHRWHDDRDEQASDTLVRANLRYAVSIAFKYRRYGLPLTDLIAEGNFGIIHALSKFEPDRGNRFVTYAAYWIRAFILNYIIRSWSLVGGGSGALRSKMFFKLRREKVRITNLVGEGEQAEEMLAERFNTSRDHIVELVGRLEARDVSLDAKVFSDSAVSLIDTLVSPNVNQEDIYDRAQQDSRVNPIVHAALDSLDRRERYIVEHRLMADDEEIVSLAELGRRLGVSRERARQLEVRAKRKLKQRISENPGSDSLDGQLIVTAA